MRTISAVLVFTVLAAGAGRSPGELTRQAGELQKLARYGEAEPLLRQAIEEESRPGSPPSVDLAVARRELGALLRATGRYAEAEAVLTDALHELEAAGAEAPEVARTLFHLSALDRARGDLARAESFAVRADAVLDDPGGRWAEERRRARLILSSVYVEQRRWDKAARTLQSVLEGSDGAMAAAVYCNLAAVALAQGEYQQGEGYAEQGLRMARLALPPNHPSIATMWNNLAQAYRLQQKYLEAEKAYREAIAIWEVAFGPSHPDLAKGLMNFGAFYHERGRETGAEDLYRRAASIFETSFGKDDPRALVARNELADVLRAERRYTESERLGLATLRALEKALGAGDPRVVRAATHRAHLLSETNRPKEAALLMSSLRPAN